MKSRLICIVFALLLIESGSAASRKNRVTANAGTGPYNFGPQTGWTSVSLSHVKSRDAVRFIDKNISLLEDQGSSYVPESDPDFPRSRDAFVAKFRGIDEEILNKYKPGEIYDALIRKDFVTVLSTLKVISRLQYEKNRDNDRGASLRSLNAGYLLHKTSAYEFNNLVYSFGERGALHNSYTTFVTGGTYFPLTSPNAGITGRFAVGFAFGDPDRTVGLVTQALYLSPFALDTAGTISTLVRPGVVDKDLSPARTLVDHIRPRDVWLTLTARQISRTARPLVLANGTMVEAELTFALNKAQSNSYKATTISLSGIYSANENLGVDELGAEVRIPTRAGPFFCGRYGTRGHYTVSLDFKF